MDKLEFLDGGSSPEVTTPAPEAAPPSQDGPPRDEHGRFAPKVEAQPEPTPEPQPAPTAQPEPHPAPQGPPPGYVPEAVIKALRDEIRSLKQAPPPAPIDPQEDPHGAYEQATEREWRTTLDWSKRLALKDHSQETVDAAFQWALARCDHDPALNQRIRSSQDPFGTILEEHNQQQLLSALQDPAKRQRLMALLTDQPAQTPAPPPAAQPAPQQQSTPPPRSLASAPSAGSAKPGEQPIGPGVAFDAAIR